MHNVAVGLALELEVAQCLSGIHWHWHFVDDDKREEIEIDEGEMDDEMATDHSEAPIAKRWR